MTVSETVIVETIPYSNIGLTYCLQICKMVVGLGPHFLLTNILKRKNFGYSGLKCPQSVLRKSSYCRKGNLCDDSTKDKAVPQDPFVNILLLIQCFYSRHIGRRHLQIATC